jgi:hypothetical protein
MRTVCLTRSGTPPPELKVVSSNLAGHTIQPTRNPYAISHFTGTQPIPLKLVRFDTFFSPKLPCLGKVWVTLGYSASSPRSAREGGGEH